MKKILVSTLLSLLSISLVVATEECYFAPTATITNTPSGLSFRDGTEIVFSGETSTPNNCSGYITTYQWTIEGSTYTGPTKTHTFNLPANVHEQSYTVSLKVWNNISLTNTTSITVTIKRPQRVYFLKDHIGNVRTSVDVDGNVLGYDDYYPFGLQMDGRSNNSSNPNDDYKFTGHEQDDEASLTMVHMNARGYDPLLGRFNQMDPLMEFSSSYTYVGNNPLNYTDPTGMSSCGSSYVTFCGQDGEIYASPEAKAQADNQAIVDGLRTLVEKNKNGQTGSNQSSQSSSIENDTPESSEVPSQQTVPEFGPNPYFGEMEYFEGDLITFGLQLMWLLSHPGKEEGVAVELAAYLLEDENGNFSLVIFNPATYGNTSRSGSFYLPNYDGSNTTYRDRHVIAFIHTHPGWNVNGNIVAGGNAPSDTDLATARKFNMQGFILGQRGVSHFSAQGRSSFLGSRESFFQGNRFLEEAIKRYR
ncbi:MAG: PKD domain-containing protein [Balneola sp.]|nr:MAG: PKD domain-containing protein [Balneola sp.]